MAALLKELLAIFIFSIIGGVVLAIYLVRRDTSEKSRKAEELSRSHNLVSVENKSYSYEVGSKSYGYNGWEKTKVIDVNKISRFFSPVYRYKVTGINPLTNRTKSAIVVISDTATMEEIERKSGLKEISKKEKIFEPPTEKQISYARDLGINISSDMDKDDLSCIMHRVLDAETTTHFMVENMENPPQVLWDKLIACNKWCSAYTSELGLVSKYYSNCLDTQDQVVFYLAIMYCKQHNLKNYNIWSLPTYNAICDVSKELLEDDSFRNSFYKEGNITANDLVLSNYFISRQCKASKMAWNALKEKGLVSGEPKKRKYSC